MSRIFSYDIINLDEHNTIVIRSLMSSLRLISVWTIDYRNINTELVASPINFEGLLNSVGISYPSIRSKTIYFDIDTSDMGLILADLLKITVTDSIYKKEGTYRSQFYTINAGNNIQPVTTIVNNSAALIDCLLELRFYDTFGNIRTESQIPLLVNDDGKLVYTSIKKDTKFSLPLAVTDMKRLNIFVDGIQIPEANYSLSTLSDRPDQISFDSRNIDGYTVVYIPDLYVAEGLTQLTKNISMNRDNLIVHNIKDIVTIEYRFILNMINLDPQLVDQTPIIQTLGLVTY